MNTEQFKIRPYGKADLARMYFPETRNRKSAVANLRNMIKRCRPLTEALADIGYNPNVNVFTPREIALVVQYIGPPFSYDE